MSIYIVFLCRYLRVSVHERKLRIFLNLTHLENGNKHNFAGLRFEMFLDTFCILSRSFDKLNIKGEQLKTKV